MAIRSNRHSPCTWSSGRVSDALATSTYWYPQCPHRLPSTPITQRATSFLAYRIAAHHSLVSPYRSYHHRHRRCSSADVPYTEATWETGPDVGDDEKIRWVKANWGPSIHSSGYSNFSFHRFTFLMYPASFPPPSLLFCCSEFRVREALPDELLIMQQWMREGLIHNTTWNKNLRRNIGAPNKMKVGVAVLLCLYRSRTVLLMSSLHTRLTPQLSFAIGSTHNADLTCACTSPADLQVYTGPKSDKPKAKSKKRKGEWSMRVTAPSLSCV